MVRRAVADPDDPVGAVRRGYSALYWIRTAIHCVCGPACHGHFEPLRPETENTDLTVTVTFLPRLHLRLDTLATRS